MSTINKVDKQQKLSKGRRLEALAFFRRQSNMPGAPGVIAAQIYSTLLAIHRDSSLNGPEKENEFKRIIQRSARLGAAGPAGTAKLPAAPGTPAGQPEQPEATRLGELPAGDGVPAVQEGSVPSEPASG